MSQGIQSQGDRVFFLLLTQFQDRFATETVETSQWWDDWQKLKHLYDIQISINWEGDDRWQAVRTEIHRAMKLLETDLLFLRSAKQVTTKQQRIGSIVSRLEQLQGYLKIILGNNNE